MADYCENRTENIDTVCEENCGAFSVKSGGPFSNHWALRGLNVIYERNRFGNLRHSKQQ